MEEHIEILRTLGLKIKEIRESKGISLSEFSRKCDKDRQSMYRLEKGNTNVTIKYLLEVAKGLDVSIKDLFDF